MVDAITFIMIHWATDRNYATYTLPSGRSPSFLIVLARKGRLSLEADGKRFTIQQAQLIVVLLRSRYKLRKSMHSKYVLAVTGYSHDSFAAASLMVFATAPKTIVLEPKEVELLWRLLKLMTFYKDTVRPLAHYSDSFLSKGLQLLTGYIDSLYANVLGVAAGNRAQELTLQFLRLAIKWCRVHHGMQFYADSLFVTRAHLNKVIKQTIGLSAKYCVAQCLLAEAKLLLQDRKSTVATVSDTLNFSDPAVFTRFFVRHCGISPGQYRHHNGSY